MANDLTRERKNKILMSKIHYKKSFSFLCCGFVRMNALTG